MKTTAIAITLNPIMMSVNTPFPSQQNEDEGYIPGTCNIGKAELEKRKQAAIFSAVLTIICIALMQYYDVDRIWKLLIFIPATSFAVSFQQWYFKFCVAFGIKGVFNYGNKTLGVLDFKKKTFDTLTDEQKVSFKKDRKSHSNDCYRCIGWCWHCNILFLITCMNIFNKQKLLTLKSNQL